MNVYELWYEFLKLAYEDETITVSAKVREDFGDLGEVFDDWWVDHAYLFEREEPLVFRVIDSAEEYNQFHCDDDLVVLFMLDRPKEELLEVFSRLLDENQHRKMGRPQPVEMAEYDLASYQRTDTLKKVLDVLNERKNESLKLYQIGEALSLNPVQIPKDGELRKDISDKRRNMTVTVSRYLRWGKEIKENVAKGIFPKHNR